MTRETDQRALGRRDVLKAAGAGALAITGAAMMPKEALATPETAAKRLAELIGGKATKEGKITIKLPEIAENGASVPTTVNVDSPMTADDHVTAVHILADGNPTPNVATFNMTPASGKAEIAIRIRLAKTQNVIVAAEMSNGEVYTASKECKVTIGGCGG